MSKANKLLGFPGDDLKDVNGSPIYDEEHYFLKKIGSDLYPGIGNMVTDKRNGGKSI